MNMNQLINMALRIVMRKGINAGIKGAMGMAGKRGKAKQPKKDAGTLDQGPDPKP